MLREPQPRAKKNQIFFAKKTKNRKREKKKREHVATVCFNDGTSTSHRWLRPPPTLRQATRGIPS